MALTNQGWSALVILGAKNDKTRAIRLKMDATVTDETGAAAAITAFLTDLAGVSAGVVKSYSLTVTSVEDAYNRPTSDDAEWRDTAQVVTDIEDQPLKAATIRIPMPLIGIMRGTAGELMDEVDVADAALIAYVDNFRAAGKFTVSDGEKVGAVIKTGKRVS